MTEEQERVLVLAVERLTISVATISSALLRVVERVDVKDAGRVATEVNRDLCDAFPWLNE